MVASPTVSETEAVGMTKRTVAWIWVARDTPRKRGRRKATLRRWATSAGDAAAAAVS